MQSTLQRSWAPAAPGVQSIRAAHAAGAVTWATLVFAVAAGGAVVIGDAPLGLGALYVLAATALLVLVPPRLRRLTRSSTAGAAFAEGATRLHHATAAGQLLALGAMVAVLTSFAISGGGDGVGARLAHDLAGAVMILGVCLGGLVVFPGGWLLSSRTEHPLRWLWIPLLVAAALIVYPGSFLLRDALIAGTVDASPLALSAVSLLVLGALSASTMAAAKVLLPRPFVTVDATAERLIATRAGGAWLVDLTTGARIAVLPGGRRIARFSADGTLAVIDGRDEEVIVVDTRDGAVLRRLSGGPAPATALAFDAAGERVAAVGSGARLTVWRLDDPATIQQITLLHGYSQDVAFTTDGRAAIVTTSAGAMTRAPLDVTREPQRLVGAPEGRVTRACLAPDGRGVAFALGTPPDGRRVAVYDIEGGSLVPRWEREANGIVRALSFDDAGRQVTWATIDGDVGVRDRATGGEVQACDARGDVVASVGLGEGGRLVVGGRWLLRAWDAATGRLRPIA